MNSIYLAGFLFGGVLVMASAFGGHDHATHEGGLDDHGPPKTPSLALFSLRFWSFALGFFGLSGLALGLVTGLGPPLVGVIAGIGGLGAGFTASRVMRGLAGQTVGTLLPGGTLVGREGKLLLPVSPGQRGKLRVLISGTSTDIVVETESTSPLPAGSTVLIVGLRDTVAVVEPSPAPPTDSDPKDLT